MSFKKFQEFLADNYPNEKCNQHTVIEYCTVEEIAHQFNVPIKQAMNAYMELGMGICGEPLPKKKHKCR